MKREVVHLQILSKLKTKSTNLMHKKFPDEIKNILRNVKNEEKREDFKQEKIMKNLIHHGSEEWGNNPKEIKSEDNKFISDILHQIGVKATVLSTTRQ